MHRIIKIILVVVLVGCGDSEPENASMIEALFATDRFDGQRIVIFGYLVNRMEDRAIYISKEFADKYSVENSAWVNFSEKVIIMGNPIPFNRESIPECVFDNLVAIEGVLRLRSDRYPRSRPAIMEEVNYIYVDGECGKDKT